MGEISWGIVIYMLLSSTAWLLLVETSSYGGPHGAGEIESCSLQTSARFSPALPRRLQVNSAAGGGSEATGNRNVLVCQIRTLHSDLNLTSLLSVPSSAAGAEGVVKLKLICNDLLFFESVLQSGQLRPFSGLEELEIDRCKLGVIAERSFGGLSRLRKLSIRTGNADWPARSLEISPGAFLIGSYYSSLEDLHLGYNNIRVLPGDFFCQVGNLQTLNLTHNLLSNINDLGLVRANSVTNDGGVPSAPSSSCGLALKSLDLSFNAIQSLGKFSLPSLLELRLDHNRIEELQPSSFNPLIQLRSLNLSSNLLVSLPADAFSSCRHLRELYLQNNSLTQLLPGLFSNLEHLHTLDLSHNQLSNNFMAAGTFENLARLVILNLAGNQLSEVTSGTFNDLRALQLLDLSNNLISEIQDGSFGSLKNLHALNLAGNRLSVVNGQTFAGLPVLHRLVLDYNSIKTVSPDAFANSSGSLQDISLVRNELESVPEALRNLPIRTLDLGENRIRVTGADSFVGLTQLYGLRLVGNQVEEIGPKFCQFTPRLRALNLAGNKISKIHLSAFQGCPQLKVLRLDSNNLTTALPPSLPNQLPSLLWLNLSTNGLEYLDYTALPTKLEWLDFSYNHVHTLWNAGGGSPTLDHLRVLDGSHNNLSQIDQQSFPQSVEVIRLGHNSIRLISPDSFSGLKSLRRVELNHNALTHLDLKALRLASSSSASAQAASNSRPLTEFFIAGNPFTCDCDMEWLTRVNSLSSLRSAPFVVDIDSIQCHLHFSRFEPTRSLIEMKAQDFLCSYSSHCFALCHCCEFDACDCQMTCPSGCTCYHDDTWTANVVDCAGGNHSAIPSQLPMDSTEVYLDGNDIGQLKSHGFIGRKNLRVLYLNASRIEVIANKSFNGLHSLQLLQLSHNSLAILHGYEFEQLARLRELYLNGNLIRSISNDTFLPLKSLEILNLAGNRLVTYSVWQLSLNRNLMVLRMADNSWDCSACTFLQHLDRWAMENAGKIGDLSQLRCMWNKTGRIVPGPLIRNINATCFPLTGAGKWALIQLPAELEPLFPWFCAGLLLCLLIISFVVVVRLSESVKYGIFWATGIRVSPLCCPCCSENNEGSEKCVDAYFIYSEADGEFVTKRIVDELEDNGDYRLSLLYRENCTAPATATTTQRMQIPPPIPPDAPVILILLSNNFLRTEWANLEFRAQLLQQLLTDKSNPARRRRRVLLLVKDDTSQAKINSDFLTFVSSSSARRTLKSRTLRWTSKDFWSKLKFHLGDPRQQRIQSDCTSSSYAYSNASRHCPGSSASSVYKPSTPSLSHPSPKVSQRNEILADKLWPYGSTMVPNHPHPALVEAQPEPPPHFQDILRKSNFNLNNYATYLSQMSKTSGTSQRGRLYAGRASYGTINSICYSSPGVARSQFTSSPQSSSATESTTLESCEVSHGTSVEDRPEETHHYAYCNGGGTVEEDEGEAEHVYFSLEPSSTSSVVASSPKLPQVVANNRVVVQCEPPRFNSSANHPYRSCERKLQTFLV